MAAYHPPSVELDVWVDINVLDAAVDIWALQFGESKDKSLLFM